jgi:hypothetical protein
MAKTKPSLIWRCQKRGNSFPVIPASILECASYSSINWDSTDLIRSGRQERSSKLFSGVNNPKEGSESSCISDTMYVYLNQHQLSQGHRVHYEEHDK